MPTGRKSLAALPFAFPHLSRPPRLERVNDGDWSDSDSDVEDVLFHAGERLVWRQYPNGRAAESHDQHPRACKEWCCDKDSDESQGAVLQTSPPRSSTDESNDSRNFWDHAARVLGKAGVGPASPSVARRQFQRHVGKENCPPNLQATQTEARDASAREPVSAAVFESAIEKTAALRLSKEHAPVPDRGGVLAQLTQGDCVLRSALPAKCQERQCHKPHQREDCATLWNGRRQAVSVGVSRWL